jgi:general nucleoside transport system permease protein
MLGAFAAVWVGVRLADLQNLPASFLLPLLAAAIGGGLLGAIAGALRAWREINEIVTTIMLSFVAILFVQYWIAGPFRAPDLSFAASPDIVPGFQLTHFGEVARVPSSIVLAIVMAAIVAWWMHYTRAGWRYHLVGLNARLAQRKGIDVRRSHFTALTAGGALAGLGGGAEAIGNQLHVGFGFSPGWGFDAVAIALLARGSILAVVPVALFFAFLRNGAGLLQSDLDVPGTVVTMLGGAPVLVVAGILGWRQYRRMRTGDT